MFLDPFGDDPDDLDAPSFPEPEVLRGWRMPDSGTGARRRIAVSVGDLSVAPAEVLCVSTNPRLTLLGGTGSAIVEAGGWKIRREADAIRQRHATRTGSDELEPGSVVRTGAGRLPHRAILHCVASGPGHRSSKEVVRRCVRGALEAATAEGAASLAMPIFASGHVGLPFARALATIVDALVRSEEAIGEVLLAVDRPDRAREVAAFLDTELGRDERS